METIDFLYDQHTTLLGEVRTRNGACDSILLTPQGEEMLGETIAAWQTNGIPVGQVRVQLCEPCFARALAAWMRFMRYNLVPDSSGM